MAFVDGIPPPDWYLVPAKELQALDRVRIDDYTNQEDYERVLNRTRWFLHNQYYSISQTPPLDISAEEERKYLNENTNKLIVIEPQVTSLLSQVAVLNTKTANISSTSGSIIGSIIVANDVYTHGNNKVRLQDAPFYTTNDFQILLQNYVPYADMLATGASLYEGRRDVPWSWLRIGSVIVTKVIMVITTTLNNQQADFKMRNVLDDTTFQSIGQQYPLALSGSTVCELEHRLVVRKLGSADADSASSYMKLTYDAALPVLKINQDCKLDTLNYQTVNIQFSFRYLQQNTNSLKIMQATQQVFY